MVKKKQYLFEGKDSQPVLLQNYQTGVVCVFFVLTVFCRFLRFYRPRCPRISNLKCPLQIIFFLRGTKAGNPERARWVHIARSGRQSEHRIRFILPTGTASDSIERVVVVTRYYPWHNWMWCNYQFIAD